MSNFFTYIFSEAEKKSLIKCLDFSINPYTHFQVFYEHIKTLIASNKISEDFSQACFSIKQMTLRDNPAFIFRNAPIDQYLPILDISNPLTSKYKLKKTFVSEAFLTVFAELCGNTILGYKNINNGDHFHDVAPMKTLLKSQSQKSLVTLGFHNDLPNNYARPDWVNILCLRSHKENLVSTTIVNNSDIIRQLDSTTLSVLGQEIFMTPHEVISVYGGKSMEGVVKKAIYNAESCVPFYYFETRTIATTKAGEEAIAKLDHAIHATKQRVFLSPGDFISIANNYCLHAREIVSLTNKAKHQERWLQKTFNVNDLTAFDSIMLENTFRVVNE